jgi:uncharacterized protein YegL
MSIDDFFWDSEDESSSTDEVAVEVKFGTEPHVPVVMLVDRSGSMSNDDNIGQLNRGMESFKQAILRDPLASKRVDLCVISFNEDCRVEAAFGPVHSFCPPQLQAQGLTAMGSAIRMGMETLRVRLQQYKVQGIDCYRPWVVLMTDGLPTDMTIGDQTWRDTQKLIQAGEASKRFMFFGIGVAQDALPALTQLGTARPPLLLRRDKFDRMFDWLSSSFSSISQSQPGGTVTGITEPTNPVSGWGDIPA